MKKEDFQEIIQDTLFELECFLSSLTFLVLKMIGTISWAWFWVLFPMWVLITLKIIAKSIK